YPEGRGPSRPMASRLTSSATPDTYETRKNRCRTGSLTGEATRPTRMVPPNQRDKARTYTYRRATTAGHYNLSLARHHPLARLVRSRLIRGGRRTQADSVVPRDGVVGR